MWLDALPPSHPQPGSKNKGRCVIKCYQSAIKSGENLRNLRVFRVLNREKRVVSVMGQTPFRSFQWLKQGRGHEYKTGILQTYSLENIMVYPCFA